jgi:hypothetical protein
MKLKFGALVVDGSGKIGGHVVSKNRGGKYLRTKSTPTNPQTQAQTAQRATLGGLASSWPLLTDAQRLSFNSAVNDFIGTDIFGDQRTPSGNNLYVGLNMNTTNGGFPLLTSAPAKENVNLPVNLSADFDLSSETLRIAFSTELETDVKLLVYATPSLSPGKSYAKNQFRLIGSFIAAGTDFEDTGEVYLAYVAKYGTPALGANIQIAIRRVVASGQVSPLQKVTASVIA